MAATHFSWPHLRCRCLLSLPAKTQSHPLTWGSGRPRHAKSGQALVNDDDVGKTRQRRLRLFYSLVEKWKFLYQIDVMPKALKCYIHVRRQIGFHRVYDTYLYKYIYTFYICAYICMYIGVSECLQTYVRSCIHMYVCTWLFTWYEAAEFQKQQNTSNIELKNFCSIEVMLGVGKCMMPVLEFLALTGKNWLRQPN